MKIAVVIVNHNAAGFVRRAIASLEEGCGEFSYESIVIDDSDAPERIAEAGHWEAVENRGFGAGCNRGAKLAGGELLLFLNPDGEAQSGAVAAAARLLLSEPDAGLVGIRTLLPDGSFETGCLRGFPTPLRSAAYLLGLDRLFPRSRTLGGYRMNWLDREQNQEVESVSGSFMLLRRDFFEELGGFDERFFMYGEDLDLCWRVREAGKKVLYCADGVLLHHHGQCGRNPRQTAAFYESMTLFYDKNFRSRYSFVTTALVHGAVGLLKKRAMRAWRNHS